MANGLYSLISEKRLDEVLTSLQIVTGLSVCLLDGNGAVLHRYGEECGYCRLLADSVFADGTCTAAHRDGGRHAQMLGEAYLFTCGADLNHIAFPLTDRKELLGTVLLGPFLMDTPDATLVASLSDRETMTPELAVRLCDRLLQIPVVDTLHARHIVQLTGQLLSSLLPSERLLLLQTQEKMYQQARINETIQRYKDEAFPDSRMALFDKERALLGRLRTGSSEAVESCLNEWIALILFTEGNRVETLRMHAFELATVLSRAAVEEGVRADLAAELQSDFYALTAPMKTVEEICLCLRELTESYRDELSIGRDGGDARVRQALRYIADHYSEPIGLEDVAAAVELSPNHLSAIFRKATGIGFREHLCRVRVEESKHLLLSTHYTLTDIAIAMGFNDQSYYCKVFRRIVGVTPGRYRGEKLQ